MSNAVARNNKVHRTTASKLSIEMDRKFKEMAREQAKMTNFSPGKMTSSKGAPRKHKKRKHTIKEKKKKKKKTIPKKGAKKTITAKPRRTTSSYKDEIASLQKTVKQLKAHANKKVVAAHRRAIAAINKVKSHVKHMQAALSTKVKQSAQQSAQHEKEKMIAVVKRIAGKAALALNAANVASELHKTTKSASSKRSQPLASTTTSTTPKTSITPPTRAGISMRTSLRQVISSTRSWRIENQFCVKGI